MYYIIHMCFELSYLRPPYSRTPISQTRPWLHVFPTRLLHTDVYVEARSPIIRSARSMWTGGWMCTPRQPASKPARVAAGALFHRLLL
jgi:hypothetical protein